MKILVVGGAGYIGGAVTDILAKGNVPFTVYDNLLYEERYLKPVDFIYGDVRDTEKLGKILPQYSHVIWLAAVVGDGACAIRPEAAVEINEVAVKWLAEHFSGRIVFTSTSSVYGHHSGEIDEQAAKRPMSLYAATKSNAEEYLKNKNALILRLGTAFGVSDTYSRPRLDLLVNTFTAHAMVKGVISVFGGNQWRPLIHVKDIAETIVRGLSLPIRGIYNVAMLNHTVDEIAAIAKEEFNCEVHVLDQLQADTRNYHVTVAKAQKDGLLTLPTKRDIRFAMLEFKDMLRAGRLKDLSLGNYSNREHLATKSV